MTDFLAGNWLWIVLIVAMFAMHRGGHGSHDDEGGGDPQGADPEGPDHAEHR